MTETPDRILRIKAVLERTGLSRSTLYRKMQNGTFPKSIPISTRCAGWRESAVDIRVRNPIFYLASDHSSERALGRLSKNHTMEWIWFAGCGAETVGRKLARASALLGR